MKIQLPKDEERYDLLVTEPQREGNCLSDEGIALEEQNNVSIKTIRAIGEKLQNNSPIEDIVPLIDVLVEAGTLNWRVMGEAMHPDKTMLYYISQYMNFDNFKTYAALVRYSLEKGANPGILTFNCVTSAECLYNKLLVPFEEDEALVGQYEDELYDLLGNMIDKAPNCVNQTYVAYGSQGNTILHRAGSMENKKLFVFLASKGADLERKNDNGNTPLEEFVKAGGNGRTLVKRLEKEGVTVTSQVPGVSNRFTRYLCF